VVPQENEADMKGGWHNMFKLHEKDEQYIERENDFENTESNTYLACVYAQLSAGQSVADGLQVPVQEYCF